MQRRFRVPTMFLFLSIFSLIIIACLALQFYIVFNSTGKTSIRNSTLATDTSIKRKTDNVMSAVKTGKIKKHLSHRKDLVLDNGKVEKSSDFLHNNVTFNLPLDIEEKRYSG